MRLHDIKINKIMPAERKLQKCGTVSTGLNEGSRNANVTNNLSG